MRDYSHVERFLNELQSDVYGQPPDEGHQAMLEHIVAKWLPDVEGLDAILDVGCGQGQAFPALRPFAERVEGVTLGEDVDVAQEAGLPVRAADMTFLPFQDGEFTLIFARHILEHSPAPLLTLMEWHRVSRQWLLLVVPTVAHFGISGKNHYYMLQPDQWERLMDRAGWHVVWSDQSEETEHRWFCERAPRGVGHGLR